MKIKERRERDKKENKKREKSMWAVGALEWQHNEL